MRGLRYDGMALLLALVSVFMFVGWQAVVWGLPESDVGLVVYVAVLLFALHQIYQPVRSNMPDRREVKR
jgi:heme A synthase